MQFADVNGRYAELKQQFQSGAITAEQFDEALKAMMVQDDQGRWWAKARETGDWNYYDNVSGAWVRAEPPMAAPAAPAAPTPPPYSSGPTPGTIPPVGGQTPVTPPYSANPYPAGRMGGGAASGGELTPTMKIIFYVLSFFIPIVGIVLFFVYRGKPAPEDRQAANLFLILGIVSIALTCMCAFLSSMMSNAYYY